MLPRGGKLCAIFPGIPGIIFLISIIRPISLALSLCPGATAKLSSNSSVSRVGVGMLKRGRFPSMKTASFIFSKCSRFQVYKAEDFIQNGASHAYFLGEDVLATASPNAPEFSLVNGHLILEI